MGNDKEAERGKSSLSPEAKLKIFKQVQRMLKEGAEGIKGSVGITDKGMTSFDQMVALMSNQPSIDVDKTNKGNVIWWTDESGSSYYYLVDEEGNDFPMQGTLQVTDKNGDLVLEGEQVEIIGATLGTSIRIGHISKNLMVEFAFPPKIPTANREEFGRLLKEGIPIEDIRPQMYRSGLVQNMGIIQRDLIYE